MDTLNQNVAKLNHIYEIQIQSINSQHEMQIQSINSQMEAINRINAGLMRIREIYDGSVINSSVFRSETEKMTHQIAALNTVYSRLLNAMTMNMNMQGATGYQNPQNPNPAYAPYNPGYNPNPNPGYYNPGYTPNKPAENV
jgi:hypothetical protein